MKKKREKIFSGILIFCLVFQNICGIWSVPENTITAQASSSSFVVVLDPGHDSSHARGANASSGLVEEEVSFAIAKACKKELEAAGFKVYLTRETAACPAGSGSSDAQCLAHRAAFAAMVGCDLYVSLHLNASGSNTKGYRSPNGSRIYISSYTGYQSSLQRLAQKIGKNLYSDCGISNQYLQGGTLKGSGYPLYNDGKNADYYRVLRDSTYNGFPSVLIEHAFMDNKYDSNQIKQKGAQAFGKADAKAIISWYQEGTGITKNSAPASNNISTGYVSYKSLNLRAATTVNSKKVAELSKNDIIYIYRKTGNWYSVIAKHNNAYYQGYVSSEGITISKNKKYPSSLTGIESDFSNTSGSDTSGNVSDNSGNTEVSLGYVNFSYLNVRSGPGTSYKKIDTLYSKAAVTIVEKTGSWYKISYTSGGKTKTGYVSSKYITLSNTQSSADSSGTSSDTAKKTGYVNFSYLNVRSGPGTSCKKTDTLYSKATVTIVEQTGSWYKISYTSGGKTKTGYVSSKYITLSDTQSSADSSGTSSDTAKKTGYVNFSYLNVRSGPGTSYKKADTLYLKATVTIVEQTESWYKISYTSGGKTKTGYVAKKYITLK